MSDSLSLGEAGFLQYQTKGNKKNGVKHKTRESDSKMDMM
jgi:hypothetical protein